MLPKWLLYLSRMGFIEGTIMDASSHSVLRLWAYFEGPTTGLLLKQWTENGLRKTLTSGLT